MKSIIRIILVVLLLLIFSIGGVSARNLVGVSVDYAQYGEYLGERGFGNMLYNYTYDDGVYILKARLGQQMTPKLALYGDGSPADIRISSHVSGPTWSGKYQYMFMYCDSELVYQHDTVTRSSYRCGDAIINIRDYTPDNFLIFQNNLVQRALCYVDTTVDVDRIFMNGVQWYPPQKGTLTITSNPSGANILDSSGMIGNTPITISKSGGNYEFTVGMVGYNPLTKSSVFTSGVYGGAGSSNTLDFVLSEIKVPQPLSEQPLLSIGDIIFQIWDWIKGFLGLSIVGVETLNVGAGQQTYIISVTSSESPDNVYTDKTYSEIYGTWFVVDSSQNVITQKSGWSKLSDNIYTDSVLVTFPSVGTYSIVGVIVKTPYTYGTSWVKGTETIVAKEQMKVTVSMPAPIGGIPSISISDIISSIINWLKSLFGLI